MIRNLLITILCILLSRAACLLYMTLTEKTDVPLPYTRFEIQTDKNGDSYFIEKDTGHDYLVDPKTGKATKLKERIEK